jgi:hypothetical protein
MPKTKEQPQETQSDTPVATKKPKVKHTYMLHDPISLEPIAKMSSVDPRYCALKVASRMAKLPASCAGDEDGTVKIWLRKTNTKVLREYVGTTITLENPQKIVRAGREIVYTRRPSVKFVKTWVWGQEVPEEEAAEERAAAAGEQTA